ncbi:MAG TPA: PfkB family carbohydrate kinase, partial [Symbiobacteriaceae bacterium]|nr:PfkB family carbohydrate kinase [Symbiobacteriaceae bacterium]
MSTKRVLTVALNAAVDVAWVVDDFGVGKINTVREAARMAGGKANNVARVLSQLGPKVIATGFAGGSAGQFIQADLRRNGIEPDYEPVAGENRTCPAIIDPVNHTLTEIREKGPVLTEADGERFLDRFRRLVSGVELVIISGSLPPGLPTDFYRTLVTEAYRTAQVRTILDASGKALREALPAQPYMVQPNQDELAEW